MAEMIFKKIPFFKGEDNDDQLVKISQVMGSIGLTNYIKKYNLKIDVEEHKMFYAYPKVPFTNFVNSSNKSFTKPEALDLLECMLVYDKAQRINAKDAMEHKYFEPVKKYLAEKNQSEQI